MPASLGISAPSGMTSPLSPSTTRPAGLADRQVLAVARRERRILITDDRDFGELVFVRKLPHAGVIYLRLGESADLVTKIERLVHVLSHHATQLDRFLVVTRQRVRVGSPTAMDHVEPE